MNIRIERVKKRWSQTDLSIKAGVCRTTISNIENGKLDNVQIGVFKKLAKAFDVPVSYLLEE